MAGGGGSSGAPVSLFYLGVIFIKRFISFFLALALAVGLASDLAPRGKAVAPLALVQAALVSYVASTGYKIWVDNGTGSDLLVLISDLYDNWLADISGNTPMTLEQFAVGDYVFSDNSANIILTKTAADTFQQFSDWLSSEYSITAGGSSVVVSQGGTIANIPAGSTSGSYDITSLVDPLSCFEYVLSTANPNINWTTHRSTITDFINNHAGSIFYITCATSPSITGWGAANITAFPYVATFVANRAYSGTDDLQFYGSTSNGVISFDSYRIRTSRTGYANYGMDLTGGTAYCLCVNGSITHSVGLSLQLAQDIVDKAAGLVVGKSLVLDVGGTVGDTADEIVNAVISGYDIATGTLSVTDSIVDTVVIDTPVQPYPDVDSLGLPELGLALTTRFPFSIPWDIGAIYGALSHSEVPPVKTFDLIPSAVLARWGVNASASITLDFTQEKYQVLFAIVRWACIIGFCLGLATLTKRYIWTTGG